MSRSRLDVPAVGRTLILRVLRFPFRDALLAFFRSIEVEGAEQVPASGPLLLLPNHLNAFVDPLVVQHGLRRPLTITAKNTLATRPLYGLLMRLARVVPFHRQDEWGKGAQRRETFTAFDECRRRLAAGEAVCVFPEGISHDDSRMRAFRAGPAQIALDFVERDGDPGGLRIVPVGLVYDAKEHARSRALVRFGEPFEVKRWLDAHPDAGRRELTEEIETRVRALVVEYRSRREQIVATFAARVVVAARQDASTLAAETREARRLVEPLRRPAARLVRDRVVRYRAALRRAGVGPEDVFAVRASTLGVAARDASVLALGLPIAIVGIVLNAVPLAVVGRIVRRFSTLRDLWASNAVFAGAVAFPLAYAAEAAATALFAPPATAPAIAITGWLSGRLTLRYYDRARRAVRGARAAGQALRGDARWQALVDEGRALAEVL